MGINSKEQAGEIDHLHGVPYFLSDQWSAERCIVKQCGDLNLSGREALAMTAGLPRT